MREQVKKGTNATVFQESRKKREQEVSSIMDGQKQQTDTEVLPAAKRRVGRPASEKTSKMSIVMHPDLRRRLKIYCSMYNTTAADVIDKLVRDMLEKADIPDLPSSS